MLYNVVTNAIFDRIPKLEIDEATEKTALIQALASQEMNNLSEVLAYREDRREILLETLLGKVYKAETATGFDNYIYDILLLAEGNFEGEEFQQRLQGIDQIGAGNAFILLAAGYKYAEALANNANSTNERNGSLQSQQCFERELLSHLRKYPDAAQADNLPLNLAQVDAAFLHELEAKQREEQREAKDNKNSRILGIALIALTLGSAIAVGYNLYQQQAALAAKPGLSYGPDYPENICQGPDPKFCENNLSIPRSAMPQLDKEVTEKFVQSYQRNNVTVEYETVPASSLFSTQKELLSSKVNGMVKSFVEGKYNPCKDTILVARHGDDHILDGHHRWAACRLIRGAITVVRIDRSIESLLKKANAFEGVEHHGLHQFDFKQKKA